MSFEERAEKVQQASPMMFEEKRMSCPVLVEYLRTELLPAERDGHLPLSFAQQRLWFLAQMGEAREAYHISFSLQLQGKLDDIALRRALDRIVARHEALRTSFVLIGEEPEQRIGAQEESGFHLVEHDLRQHSDAKNELDRLVAQEADTPFDLEKGPLIRGRLIWQAEDAHVLLITMHHIVSDGWSMGLLTKELGILYDAFVHGEADPLPELPLQYVDYAVWQRKWLEDGILRKQADYWQTTLTGAPALLTVPADHPRPAQQDYAGAFEGLVLEEKLTAGLRALSRRHGTTLYMTLLAGWATLLARLSGQQDLVIGTPVANRGRAEIANLIGFFVNTLALRLDLTGSPAVAELLARVKTQSIAAQQHQDIPFEQVVELAHPVRSLAHSPLFQAMFVWQDASAGKLVLPGLDVRSLKSATRGVAKFDLTLSLKGAGGSIVGGLEYATSLFEAATIQRYLGYLRSLLEAMVNDDTQTVDRLPLLSDTERHQLLYEWNDTEVKYPSDKCVHELFEEQALRSPDAIAVVFEDRELSYGELNRRANQLAHYLRGLGVRPDDRVAICAERGFEMVIALLAVLKAGGAYVPLDPAYPRERLSYMLEDSAPVALLTQTGLKGLFADVSEALPVIDLGAGDPLWRDQPETNPNAASVGLSSKHLAYVIYTSGSTGQPKGVMVEHAGLCNYLRWVVTIYRPADGAIVSSSLSFDATVTSLWGPLLCGGEIRLLREGEEIDGLYTQIQSPLKNCPLVKLTPGHLDVLGQRILSEGIHASANVFFVIGGEALLPSTVRLWRRIQPDIRLVNEYGPTETVVGCIAYDVPRTIHLPHLISIGRPIVNTRVYILDAHGEPVPVGVAGELYIGGAGVARGYLNRPELTAEKFVADRFTAEAGARMYRTGDQGRWLRDGTIEFLGRNDFQVKIRGFRIELGEIEARLGEHSGIWEAVVVAREDTAGDKRLVAYYTCTEAGESSVGAESLRTHLSMKLPEYMVPAAYVRLERLPLTPNGKLDRKALPAPDTDAYAMRGYEAPVGAIETALAEIWAEVLKLERVGRQDHFFELGGHSLLAVRLIARMRWAGLQVDVRTLFETPTLAGLAAAIGSHSDIEVPPNGIPFGCTAIAPEMLPLVELTAEEIERIVERVPGGTANIQDIYPLAPLQEGIFFHHLMRGEGDPYLLASLFSFDSRKHLEDYLGALQAVIDRHDILRTAVVWEGLPEPVQVVWRKAMLPVEEVVLDPAAGDVSKQLYTLFSPRRHRIDVRQAPLMRIAIAHDEENGRWLMMQLLHHLAGDHTTLEVTQEEIQAYLLGQAERLSEPLPFRNLVAQARLGISREEHEAFFRQLLGDVEESTAPFGLLDVQGDGTGIEQARMDVDVTLAGRIRSQARKLGVSSASLCHVAWAQVLARVAGREDVVFGTVLFGRMQGGEGSDLTMGPFINTLPLRIRVGEEGVESSVRRTHTLLGELLRHEHASLALAQRCSAVPAPAPLFSSLLNYRHSAKRARSEERKRAWEGIRGLYGEERTNYPVTFSVDDLGEGFRLTAQVEASVEPKRVCQFMHTALASLVEALESEPARPLHSLAVLPEGERRQVLYEWNATEVKYPSDRCVHELFEEQALRSPDAIAVVFEDRELSYGELNRRANRLAHYLRGLGVRPDDRVAICAERGFEMVIALLAVLKAGGAYVPLDPAYPRERLSYMLEDSAPVALLTQGHLRQLFSDAVGSLPTLELDAADRSLWRYQPETNPDPASVGLTSRHLAYVIYTSGSTGQPKGVEIPQRGVTRLVLNTNYVALGPDDVIAQASNAAFDAITFEIWGALLTGAHIVILGREEILSPLILIRKIKQHRITTLFLTTALFNQVARERAEGFASLRYLLFGGEQADPRWVARVLAEGRPEHLLHVYGPTESTTYATWHEVRSVEDGRGVPIGRPIANTRIYILDARGEPVPVGVAGELYIGGAGVARGYLNRPELTAEKFVADRFTAEAGARMYRTGDQGRWLRDGTIEFLGRNDFQVKIRGFRIELGEIEAQLGEHSGIREAVVVAREDTAGDKRLVAYYTCTEAGESSVGAESLRAHLSMKLPEYMVPAAYVRLERLPLTPNGKLDRKALPAPDTDAYAMRGYEAPVGAIETALAEIWAEVLKLERVGRQDHFFELGGHSLLAVRLIERMRRAGLQVDVRTLFETPTLAGLAAAIGSHSDIEVPPNGIPFGCTAIAPEMLPLVELTAEEIERIVERVPGGTANIQDIYPLAPLQEGIFFHHLMREESDPYLLAILFSFDGRKHLEDYLGALQAVIDRHDILRTAVVWEGLPEPVQVVWRKAMLPVEEVVLDPAAGDVSKQLYTLFSPRRHRIDVRQAPLMRIAIAHDEENGRWLMMQLLHHLAGDHTTLEVTQEEIQAYLLGQAERLSEPLPFRNLVAQARLGISREEHEAFFRQLLGDVEESTAPFGLLDVRGDGTGIEQACMDVDAALAGRIRSQARKLGVSAASLCHVAWAQVLARVAGREDVVFGTVLFGRMQGGEGSDRTMGLFINTLPLRIRVGEEGVESSVRRTHTLLGELLRHEHASLALAQRCSAVPAPAPLFSSLLNYRHSVKRARSEERKRAWEGIRGLYGEERTNYPVTFSVDDLGEGFRLTAQVEASVEPKRVCQFMHTALASLVEALESEPARPLQSLAVLPEGERRQVLYEWNDTEVKYPSDRCVHELFEEQVEKAPESLAVVFEDASLSYGELNRRANQLAHYLRGLGVRPDDRVAICAERGFEMVIALLAVLKAGGAYVPLDPAYPRERLNYMLEDSAPVALLTQTGLKGLFADVSEALPVIDLGAEDPLWRDQPETNPNAASVGLNSRHLAYVIYTSGSTGMPKGVAVTHSNVVHSTRARQIEYDRQPSRYLLISPYSFDSSVAGLFWTLGSGGSLYLPSERKYLDPEALTEYIKQYELTNLLCLPSLYNLILEQGRLRGGLKCLRVVTVAGESCPKKLLMHHDEVAAEAYLYNEYGPTEATVWSTVYRHRKGHLNQTVPIGRPIANSRVYILDARGEPVPVGVAGELYIGGAGVARGYLNRPELTAEKFVADRFTAEAGARMYKTGDQGRWLRDGTIEFLGRNDFQVKIRGFRIELGEIEARLGEHSGIREAVVVAREDTAGDKRLVAYFTCTEAGESSVGAESLRTHLSMKLPEYMVPAAYVRLERLPLTPNGKLDRKALPAPDTDAYAMRCYEAPVGAIETALAEIWAEVLKLERVGRQDDFFELGGHSLLAVRLIARLQHTLNVDVTIGDLFARPVLSSFAEHVTDAQLEQFDPDHLADVFKLMQGFYAV